MRTLEAEKKVRLLERLMHAEPTEQELIEMWHDRPRLEQLAALKDDKEPDYVHLQPYDFQLWRCKVRAELGSLIAHIDALKVCEEFSLALPAWLHRSLPNLLISLALPESAPKYKQARAKFQAETRKLKMQKRAEIVHSLYRSRIWPRELASGEERNHVRRQRLEAIGDWFRQQPVPKEVEAAIKSGRIHADFEVSSIVQASEIAHIALRGTWARASAETIRQDDNAARVQLKTDLNKKHLSSREEEFVFWDVAFVHPETLELLVEHNSESV